MGDSGRYAVGTRFAREIAMSKRFRRRTTALSALVLAAIAGTASAQLDQPFPGVFQLSSLLPVNGGDGSLGFACDGVAAGDLSGRGLSPAGDVNGDGIEDLIIGAPRADPNGQAQAGSAYVVFGRELGSGAPFGASLELSSLDGTNGFRIDGVAGGDNAGDSVACAGDVNNDGIDDVIIGARFADPGGRSSAGSAYVVFGRDMGAGSTFPAALGLSSLDGSNGFRFDGALAGDQCAKSVSRAGDVNGDGVDDAVIGAFVVNVYDQQRGACYVVYGRDSTSGGSFPATLSADDLDGSNGFAVAGGSDNHGLGDAVARAGDVNGDGVDDVLLGDYAAFSWRGMGVVVFGRDTASEGNFPAAVDVDDIDGSNGFTVRGFPGLSFAGEGVAPAGDINGDGFDDIVVGGDYTRALNRDYAGAASVVFGRGSGSSFPAMLDLGSLDGSDGFNFVGSQFYERVGHVVTGTGDVNGDGFDDLLVSAFTANSYYDFNSPGRNYVVFGRPAGNPFPALLSASDIDGTNGFRIDGIADGDVAGFWGLAACDLNNDGPNDLVIAANGADPNGSNSGQTYVVYGRHLISMCPPDLNNDGTLDFFDVQAFLNSFASQDPRADFTGDGLFDFFDVQAFLNAYAAGCP